MVNIISSQSFCLTKPPWKCFTCENPFYPVFLPPKTVFVSLWLIKTGKLSLQLHFNHRKLFYSTFLPRASPIVAQFWLFKIKKHKNVTKKSLKLRLVNITYFNNLLYEKTFLNILSQPWESHLFYIRYTNFPIFFSSENKKNCLVNSILTLENCFNPPSYLKHQQLLLKFDLFKSKNTKV